MSTQADRALRALRLLLRSAHLAGPDDLPALVTEACAHLGAVRATLFLVDYDQVLLVQHASDGPADRESLVIEGTLAGRAFADLLQHVSATDGAATL